MNSRDIEKLKSELQKTRLTPAEKASMRSDLSHFIVTNANPQSLIYSRIATYFVSYVGRSQVFAALALLFIVGGPASASALAQKALPGDLLYNMKVQVNEPFESALALSVEAKIAIDTRQATRRLDEAQALKESGRLTPEINTKLQTRFSEKMDGVDKNLIAVAAKGDSEGAAKLKVTVEKDLDARFESLSSLTLGLGDSATTTATSSPSKSKPLSATVRAVLKKHEKKGHESKKDTPNVEDQKQAEDMTGTPEVKVEGSASTTVEVKTQDSLMKPTEGSIEVETHATSTENKDRSGLWNHIEDLLKNRSSRERGR